MEAGWVATPKPAALRGKDEGSFPQGQTDVFNTTGKNVPKFACRHGDHPPLSVNPQRIATVILCAKKAARGKPVWS